ncbi:MAG: GNAT family N-acetyltransferase [Flavobacteriaceae bacterium]|nr:GNAT family N-acetyltransferase [Flavobacteriaceae bacterium]
MKIRNLKSDDIDVVINLLINSFSSRYNRPPFVENISDPKSITIVAELDDTIIGVASLYIIQKLTRKMGLIEDVAVEYEKRGQGVGKLLIKNLIKKANLQGCDKIILHSSQDNVSFYEKIGFKVNEKQMILRNN